MEKRPSAEFIAALSVAADRLFWLTVDDLPLRTQVTRHLQALFDSPRWATMGCDGCELWSATRKSCYAGTLHTRFGGVTPGYVPTFEQVTEFPGRMAEATAWTDLIGRKRKEKPWLDGLPRLIFLSDMSDALSASVSFDYLEAEIISNVTGALGSRHHWLWLTKRPERMAEFSGWLEDRGQSWPRNLWAGTSITTQATPG